jgi:hypothetical protein
MHRRTRRTLWVVAGVLVLLALAIFLRFKAPPEAARLLPEADGIVFIDLKPIRTLAHFKNLKPPTRVPEYQQFVDATGIDWERDLDQAAVALHRMENPNGPNGPVAYSMVLVGRLTGQRLNAWLESHAADRETYAGHTIYSIPSDGRTVRIVQIGYDTLAVSNWPTTEKIHSIIDRHRTAALPFAGSTLLRDHYSEVPLLSLAWGVGQVGLPFSESGAIHIFGLALPLEADSTIVASVTPGLNLAGTLNLKMEEIAQSNDEATSQAAAMATLLTLARELAQPLAANPANNGLRELLQSAEVTPKKNRVFVTASISSGLLASLAQSESPQLNYKTETTPPPEVAAPKFEYAPNASKAPSGASN